MENPTQKANEPQKPKRKAQYKEGEIKLIFKVKRIVSYYTPLMKEWLDVENPVLEPGEQYIFDKKLNEAINKIPGWHEEDLKMKYISAILDLGNILEGGDFVTFFDKTISATVEGTKLSVKSDFMIAKGIFDVFTTPYFFFQAYKRHINPTGEPMAQLLQSFLITQQSNQDGKPLYGAEVFGASWRFVIMEGKEYCLSKSFYSTKKEDLLQIIAILRKFRHILETRLIV